MLDGKTELWLNNTVTLFGLMCRSVVELYVKDTEIQNPSDIRTSP